MEKYNFEELKSEVPLIDDLLMEVFTKYKNKVLKFGDVNDIQKIKNATEILDIAIKFFVQYKHGLIFYVDLANLKQLTFDNFENDREVLDNVYNACKAKKRNEDSEKDLDRVNFIGMS